MVSNKKKAIIVMALALLVVVGITYAVFFLVSGDSTNKNSPDRDAVQSQLNEAVVLSMAGKCEEAIASFEDVASKSTSFVDIHAETMLRAGQCYMSLKKYQEAAVNFEAASKQFAELGDKPKQAQSSALYQQAATESLNSRPSEPVVNTEGPKPSVPPVW